MCILISCFGFWYSLNITKWEVFLYLFVSLSLEDVALEARSTLVPWHSRFSFHQRTAWASLFLINGSAWTTLASLPTGPLCHESQVSISGQTAASRCNQEHCIRCRSPKLIPGISCRDNQSIFNKLVWTMHRQIGGVLCSSHLADVHHGCLWKQPEMLWNLKKYCTYVLAFFQQDFTWLKHKM